MAAYAASKAGLIGMTQVLAVEHGPENIRINALLPGGTKTGMAGDDPEFLDWVSGLHALKRMADPEEIAQAALFLMSDHASFVTGSAMLVDGGNSITKLWTQMGSEPGLEMDSKQAQATKKARAQGAAFRTSLCLAKISSSRRIRRPGSVPS